MRGLQTFLTFLYTFLFFSGLHGQMIVGLDKDSLRSALNKMPADTNKVTALIRLGQQYENNTPDTAVLYYRQAEALSLRLNYQTGIVQYINNYTAILNVQGRFDSSLILNLRGVAICRQYGLKDLYVKALVNTGVTYQYKEQYLPAADYYLKALPFMEANKALQGFSVICNNLAGLYRNLNQPEKALIYSRRSLEAARQNQNEYDMANSSINLANILKALGKIPEAIPYIDTAYRIGRRLDDINIQETALLDLGNIYLETNDPDKYLPVYQQALPLTQTIKDVSGEARALQGIGVGLYWKRRYPEAEAQLQKAILFASKHDQKETLSNLFTAMSDLQIARGQPKKAQYYKGQNDSVRDLLFNTTLVKDVQELETKYKVEKQQHDLLQKTVELEDKKREALRQRNWLIIAAGSVVLLSLLLFLIYRFYRQRQQLHAEALQSLRAQQENLRLKALVEGQLQERRRIGQEMHDDMGSGLTSLLFLTRTLSQPEDTAEKIRQLSGSLIQKMNEIVWTMEHEHDTLESLIAYIRVNVAQSLENAGISYHFEVADDIPERSVSQHFRRNMYLVVKEGIHNVIRHADATSVTITVLVGQQLEIVIKDNGMGFDPGSERRFGNGMKNMRQRMEQVGGILQVGREQGTRIRLIAPLEGV